MTEDERLREFLLAIHMHQGKVCPGFETCTHTACRSNALTWELADAALQGMTLEQYHIDKNKLLKSAGSAYKCFKCGLYALRTFLAGEAPRCKACGSFDVVLLDLERSPDGDINNCALANGLAAKDCQMCEGDCPDRVRFGHYR